MAIAPGNKRFTVTLTGPVYRKLVSMMEEYGLTKSAVISMAIKKKWEEENRTEEAEGEITSE